MRDSSHTAHQAFSYPGPVLTADPGDGPVASDAGGKARQLEDEGPGIGVRIVIGGGDVDAVDVPAHPLTDLGLLGDEGRGVVVNVNQIDLQRARATGYRRACERREREKERKTISGRREGGWTGAERQRMKGN